MKVDATDIAIAKRLREGRRSYREIAQELSLSENTVRSRVGRMSEDGLLDISGLVDVESLPGHNLAMVGVKLSTMELVKMGEVFSRLRGVVSVGVVTGRYDLIVTVLLNEEFGLLEFLAGEVAQCVDSVESTETFVVYKGFNLKVPYIL